MSALQLRGDLWAMHAEQRGSMGQAVAVTDDAPTSNSSDAVLISTDSKESGLWLWQGDAPSPPSFPRPKSRDRHILRRIMPAAGWAGWIALPTGLALTLIAILMIPHPDRPVSADRDLPLHPHRPRRPPLRHHRPRRPPFRHHRPRRPPLLPHRPRRRRRWEPRSLPHPRPSPRRPAWIRRKCRPRRLPKL
jgi:hypothetical protein